MSDLASVLKKEITRLARKEIRAATEAYRKTLSLHRTDIASLKKNVKELKEKLSRLEANGAIGLAPIASIDAAATLRVSPKSIRAHRKRVGLSAESYARILGVSMQTVYHWEQGKSRPRQSQLKRLVAVRQMGKREARHRLAGLEAAEGRVPKTKKEKGVKAPRKKE